MLIRRYIAADMNQALADVKAELGPDALIVAAQHVRGRGLFAPAQVELTVTLADARSATLA